jgi:hypothetical protein
LVGAKHPSGDLSTARWYFDAKTAILILDAIAVSHFCRSKAAAVMLSSNVIGSLSVWHEGCGGDEAMEVPCGTRKSPHLWRERK